MMELSGQVTTSAPRFGTSHDMKRIAHWCNQYLCIEIIIIVNMTDLLNQFNTILIDIIQSAYKGLKYVVPAFAARIACPGEKSRCNWFYAMIGEILDGLHAILDHRNFHHNILMRSFASFCLLPPCLYNPWDHFGTHHRHLQFHKFSCSDSTHSYRPWYLLFCHQRGLVVHPSRIPKSAASFICSRLAVSTKTSYVTI